MQKQKQDVIAVSTFAKTYVKDSTADFGGPSKSKDYLAASEREIVDGLVKFVEKHRYETVTELDDDGNEREIERDRFAEVMGAIISERMDITHTRTNTAAKKVADLEAERAALLAKIAALEAATQG